MAALQILVKNMETKQAIRKQIFAARKRVTEEEVKSRSHLIAEKVFLLPEFQTAKRILVYADYNHEVMTEELIEAAWKAGKEVAVPKVTGKEMVFIRLTDFNQLAPGYFSIPEPETGEEIFWEEGLMIMPGVAFDKKCRRVGYGGGFYDRYLEKHPKLTRLALGFSFQMMEKVPVEETDIIPQILVTEDNIYDSRENAYE